MKILICTGIYPPDIGGPATYTKLLQEELPKRGHKIQVLTYGDSSQDAISVSRKYPLPLRYFFYFLKVLKLGRSSNIIYVQDPVSVGLPAALANIFLRNKMILKIVGDYSWEQAQQIAGLQVPNLDNFYPFNKANYPSKINILRKIQFWVAKQADKIITPSFYLKNILTRGWGIDDKKITVIYNSFNIQRGFSPLDKGELEGVENRSAISTTHNLKPTTFKLISVGRIVPWKGFDALIEIMRDLPNAQLDIIGDGELQRNFQFSISNFQLQDRVKLLGKLSHDEVIKQMHESNLFILNSGYEGLSHVILEAMATGLPVAVSRAGGNIELVGKNEERGYLFEYNNKEQIKKKINHIISHPEETQEKAKKASEFVAGFSKDKMIAKLAAVLAEA